MPAAPGRLENRQAEAEAKPEGEFSKHKRQPADRRKCSAGGLVSISTVRKTQWRDPITSEDMQPQQGQPGKKAPAAAGRKEEPPTEALTLSSRIYGKAPTTTPDPEQGSWRRTSNHNMGQGRTLERAKDNRRLSASVRTTRKHTCRTGREEKPQTEVRSPTIRRKGRSTHNYRRARPTNT